MAERSVLKEIEGKPWIKTLRQYSRKAQGLRVYDLVVCVAIALIMILIVRQEWGNTEVPDLQEGALSPRVVRAPRAMELVDFRATDLAREEVLKNIPSVYDLDQTAQSQLQLQRRLQVLHDVLADAKLGLSAASKAIFAQSAIEMSQQEVRLLRLRVLPQWTAWQTLAQEHYSEQRIVGTKEDFPRGAFELQALDKSTPKHFESANAAQLKSLVDFRREFRDLMRQRLNLLVAEREQIKAALLRVFTPNVTFNKKLSEDRRENVLKGFKPVTFLIVKGEIILHRGERVGAREASVLDQMQTLKRSSLSAKKLLFEILFGGFALWVVVLFVKLNFPFLLKNRKDNSVAVGVVLFSLAMFKLTMIFQMDIVADYFSNTPAVVFLFLIPVAAPTMILRFLLNPLLSALATVLFAVGTTLIVGEAALYGIYVLISGLTGSFFVANARTRGQMHRAGFFGAVASGLTAVVLYQAWGAQLGASALNWRELSFSMQHVSWESTFWVGLAGALGGWMSSAITLVLTPFLEQVLDYTTDLKLMELARMDHPLLKDLAMKAPGTYHHSIVVSTLGEAGAESIGANGLMARVGSYYHDIGKMVRPEYFTENQAPNQNKHDHTSAHLSAKIIISHVKDGSVLARKHNLGQAMIDFIEQHHGEGVVKFFYNKAQQDAAQPDHDEVVERSDYSYPGPRPHAKEVAIVALADSCEAATRSLVDPTPARVESMVHKIIFGALQEGLLDRSQLTLEEVKKIEKAFIRVLMSIHHHRIQYPDQEKGLAQDQNKDQHPKDPTKPNLSLTKRNA